MSSARGSHLVGAAMAGRRAQACPCKLERSRYLQKGSTQQAPLSSSKREGFQVKFELRATLAECT